MTDAVWVRRFDELMPVATEFYHRAVAMFEEETVLLDRAQRVPGALPDHDEGVIRMQARDWAEASFVDVLGLFQMFADCPDPDRFTPVIEDLAAAQAELAVTAGEPDPPTGRFFRAQPDFAKITTAAGFLDDWSGAAARDFKANFLDPFQARVSNQYILASVLTAAVQAEQAIWKAARSDARIIAAKALSALDQVGAMTQTEWTVMFTVIASIAAVGAAPLSGGASIALTAVGAAASVVAAVPINDGTEVAFAAQHVKGVVDQVRLGIKDLVASIEQAEQLIAERLARNVPVVHTHWQHFVAARPALNNTDTTNVRSQFGFAH